MTLTHLHLIVHLIQLAVYAQSKVKLQRHTGKQKVHNSYLSPSGAVNLLVKLEQSHQ